MLAREANVPPEPMMVARSQSFEMARASSLSICRRSSGRGSPISVSPNRAERQRLLELDQTVAGADQLEAAAPDVGHQRRPAGREVVDRGPVGKVGLSFRGDDSKRDIERPYALDELGPVPGLAHRRGGDCAHAAHLQPAARVTHSHQTRHGALYGSLVEPATDAQSGTESRLVLCLLDRGQAGSRVVIGYRKQDGVGSNVDGGQPFGGPSHLPEAAGLCRASPRSSAWCLMDAPRPGRPRPRRCWSPGRPRARGFGSPGRAPSRRRSCADPPSCG